MPDFLSGDIESLKQVESLPDTELALKVGKYVHQV